MDLLNPTSTLERVLYLLINYYPFFLEGIKITMLLALVGTFFGLMLSFLLVAMQSQVIHFRDRPLIKVVRRLLRLLSILYVDVIRGTPMVVQAALFYYGFFSKYSQNIVIAGLIVVSFNTAAYLAEILRSGMSGLGHHQMEAARSLGLSRFQALRYVVMPQVIKHSLPSINNEFITNIKDSAVLSIIGLGELFYNGKAASSQSYFVSESYFIVAVIYLLLTFTFTRLITGFARYLDNRPAKEGR
ncbi:amino acid ABC transporter permease [Entomospira culicis]|uniref:Amino acid ABC transporter permease n=1 Tax=Entomospira culicis TaxID=2719989 RepID=A0A968GJG8_9SPIO|nr:amino acid ABC transporter permease [Entomospira culicis]NIZ19963.1 amino acid ABC transporter permease [Entomospira culicis]NIZ70172.1 amino acid ABC transporter permease [Entomospira culicis]WDI38005.1 amino acid ABC transporter permease [Entomospira culicis]WDI39628.1 amino acid ABC transporter permease [Entomospira culicis]